MFLGARLRPACVWLWTVWRLIFLCCRPTVCSSTQKNVQRTVAADFHTWKIVLLGFLNKLLCFLVWTQYWRHSDNQHLTVATLWLANEATTVKSRISAAPMYKRDCCGGPWEGKGALTGLLRDDSHGLTLGPQHAVTVSLLHHHECLSFWACTPATFITVVWLNKSGQQTRVYYFNFTAALCCCVFLCIPTWQSIRSCL